MLMGKLLNTDKKCNSIKRTKLWEANTYFYFISMFSQAFVQISSDGNIYFQIHTSSMHVHYACNCIPFGHLGGAMKNWSRPKMFYLGQGRKFEPHSTTEGQTSRSTDTGPSFSRSF